MTLPVDLLSILARRARAPIAVAVVILQSVDPMANGARATKLHEVNGNDRRLAHNLCLSRDPA